MNPFSPIYVSVPIVALLSVFLLCSNTQAQPNRDNQDSEIVVVTGGDSLLRWYGHSDRSYFIQVSDPSDPLGKWNWAPIIEAGNDQEISHEIGGLAGKAFFRLKYTSLTPGPGETLDNADFDQDGLSNIEEIVPPPPFTASAATDPLNRDTDNDGLPDGFERSHGLDPNDPGTGNPNNGPIGDPDSDGVTNAEELAKVTNPQNADSDNDLVKDGEDADPKEFGIDWKLTPEPRFAVIDLPVGDTEGIFFDDLSDNGTVLLSRVIEGETIERILVDVNLNSHSFPHHFPDLNPPTGAFRSIAPALVGSSILGTRIVASPVEEECLWNPVENTYTPFLIPAHQDDIFDDRGGFRVDRTSVPPPATLKTPYGPLQGSVEGSSNPKLEKNGNIVAANGYWRFDPINNTYGNIFALPENAHGNSATLTQIGPDQQNTWNLVSGQTKLLVSKNNGDFFQTGITPGHIGTTQNGWFATSNQIWSNGSWKPLKNLVSGPAPVEATMLGMLDTGLGVARFENNGGTQRMVLLVPVYIADDKVSTGVDNVSITAIAEDGGYQENYWIMAPTDSAASPNESRFAIPLESAALNVECPNATSDPTNFSLNSTGNGNDVSWTGSGVTQDNTPEFKIGPNQTIVDLPIRVKTMKKRTLNIAVWLVPLLKSDETVKEPLNKPTKQELDEFLNSVFLPQINTRFNCIVHETDPLSFDTANGSSFGAPATLLLPENGYLDTNNNGVAEAAILRDEFYDSDANANIYIVGGVLGVRMRLWLQSQNSLVSNSNFALGHTDIGNRSCILVSSSLSSDMDEMKDTLAHEIGHIIIGAGHPDEVRSNTDSNGTVTWIDGGVAPLRGTSPITRLMCSGKNRKKDGSSCLIVKKEWDAAEAWFTREENAGRLD